MFKTDVLTRTADRLKDAAISPRIYNRDCIKHCFVVADKYRSPVIIRINIHEFDIKEIAYITPVYNFCLINEIKNIRTQHLVV